MSCAQHLLNHGITSTVFDTGKRYPGGRCSSRYLDLGDERIVMDHSAQFLSPQDESFQLWCDNQSEYIQEWNGRMGMYAGSMEILSDLPKRFVGKQGMRSFITALAQNVDIEQDIWINRVERTNHQWTLYGNRQPYKGYDAIIIAHNGKCADRLLSTANVPRIHDLLRVSFGPALPDLKFMRKMQLSSLYAMVVILNTPLEVELEGIFVKDPKSILSWICNTSAKIGNKTTNYQSWTFISTREYAALNKVPQEAIPVEKEKQVKQEMLQAFADVVNIPLSSMDAAFSKIQLWGAAVPLNRHTSPFVWDSDAQVGICGDWFTSTKSPAPGIESAWCSGKKLADELASQYCAGGGVRDVGFEASNCFEACEESHPLGDVPGFQKPSSTSRKKGPPLRPGLKANYPPRSSTAPPKPYASRRGQEDRDRRFSSTRTDTKI